MPNRVKNYDTHKLRELVTEDGKRVAENLSEALRVTPVDTAGTNISDATANAIRIIGVNATGINTVTPLRELIVHPFARGNATLTGVQYCTGVNTSTNDTNMNVEVVTVEPRETGVIKYLELGLTCAINAVSNADVVMYYSWQGRDKDCANWTTLHALTANTPGTAAIEKTISGYWEPGSEFNQVPFDVRLVINCNMTDEGYARAKNSSYFRVLYEPTP